MNQKSLELARLFFLELLKIHENSSWSVLAKAEACGRLLDLLFQEATREEKIQFTTLFARTAFACHKFGVDKIKQYWIHFFRKKLRSEAREQEAEKLYALALRTVSDCISALFGGEPPEELMAVLPLKIPYSYSEVKIREFRRTARVIALKDDEDNDRLLAQDEANPSELIFVQYNIPDRNEPFGTTIREIRQTFGFPVILSLIDIEITQDGSSEPSAGSLQSAVFSQQSSVSNPQSPISTYRPRAIVVEPDYLLDASAVAECFQGSGAEPVLYLLKKFLPSEQSVPMLIGHAANFFLDELMNNPKASFKETFPKIFSINPLAFSTLSDATIREIYQASQKHWVTLQSMVRDGFRKSGIEPSGCYLEPSFYSETYGLQGRLDVFYKNENKSAIVELKSGTPFMPNQYGIGASHFIQTLLYDLMVRSVFNDAVEPASYILYSKMDAGQLRYAPPVKAQQNEALQVRNQMVALDRKLAAIQGRIDKVQVLERITTNRLPYLKGFNRQNVELFEKTYGDLDDLERRYFNAFTGFIAREHQLAKTGIQGVDNANGLASLWLDDTEEKETNFQIIKSLRIKENKASHEEPLIVFEKTDATNPLANFRIGDIAILYPDGSPQSAVHSRQSTVIQGQKDIQSPNHLSPITTQIFKVTLVAITAGEVTVRLRCKQFNLSIFRGFESWNLEHDMMDMSFNAMYQCLFRFAMSDKAKRELLLATRAPEKFVTSSLSKEFFSESLAELPAADCQLPSDLTSEQRTILQKMLSAQDYFLLWGPPGTGKTSQMLKYYAGWIFENTDENLLLLAYTNRAVDEICEALESLGGEVSENYLRIGSRYSTGEQFEDKLLAKKIEGVSTRAGLREILERHRIFVSTLASLSNNLEMLKLKKFRRVVIDEASQILEPALVGLLPQFEQFILIGDHKQLPAVVVQDATASAVDDEGLLSIGQQNLRNSLFERLYRRCFEQGWHWAYDHLSHQGRMHADIMRFPGEHFYEGKLKILPPQIPLAAKQVSPLLLKNGELKFDWEKPVLEKRLVFLSTAIDTESTSRKTNRYEAGLIAQLVRFFQKHYPPYAHHSSSIILQSKTIGIITPYRAQIAQIRETLKNEDIDCTGLTIDTVERYQGGTRDIILISLCTNTESQLDALVSLSEEGVDRKLNVALTRAREHVVVLGNEGVLERNKVYRKLIEHCK